MPRKPPAKKPAARKPPAKKPAARKPAGRRPPARKSPGRKCRLETDPELLGRIQGMVRAGAYPERAAVAAGVPESTHYLWQQKGREERDAIADGKSPRKTWAIYLKYVDGIDHAVAEAEMVLLAKVGQGGDGWQAQLAVLERRFRERWNPKAITAGQQPPSPGSGAPTTGLDEFTKRRTERRGKKTS